MFLCFRFWLEGKSCRGSCVCQNLFFSVLFPGEWNVSSTPSPSCVNPLKTKPSNCPPVFSFFCLFLRLRSHGERCEGKAALQGRERESQDRCDSSRQIREKCRVKGKGRVGVKSDGTAPPCGFRVEGTARKVISKVGVAVGAPWHFVQSDSCSSTARERVSRCCGGKGGAAWNGL